MKIDFRNETLILGAEEEGPRFKKVKDPPPIPPSLLKRKPKLTVPMRVHVGFGVRQTIKVRVGSTKPRPWLVDTGSAVSVIDPGVVKRADLRPTGAAHRTRTYCSIVTVPDYHAPSLSVAAGQADAADDHLVQARGVGSAGILGSYSLWQYGSVVFDWPGGKLLLGVG